METKINPTDLKLAFGFLGEVGKSIPVTYRYAIETPEGPDYLSDTARWAIEKIYEAKMEPTTHIMAIRNYFHQNPKEIEYMIKRMNEAGILDGHEVPNLALSGQ